MDKIIQWKQGSKMTGSAEGAYKEVQQIIKREGGATPAAVVERARNKRSALHRHFDWDDGIAAEKWRLRQGGKLLQSIEIIDMERPAQPVRALSVVTTRPSKSDEPPRKVYQSTEEALADPVMRDEILGNAIRDAIAFRRKYHALQELSKVIECISDFVESAQA